MPELAARGNDRGQSNGKWAEETAGSRQRQQDCGQTSRSSRKMAMVQTLPLDMITKYGPQFHVRRLGIFILFIQSSLACRFRGSNTVAVAT